MKSNVIYDRLIDIGVSVLTTHHEVVSSILNVD